MAWSGVRVGSRRADSITLVILTTIISRYYYRPMSYAAFSGTRLLRRGPLVDVLAAIKVGRVDGDEGPVQIFDNETGREVDFDLRGSLEDVLARTEPNEPPRRPGRPRLGVEGREVTLLPRHWAWLADQRGGASAALRRLVEEASRRVDPAADTRKRRDATYRVMVALAGNRPGFEEAARALFAGDRAQFESLVSKWPTDIGAHLVWMAGSPAGDGAP